MSRRSRALVAGIAAAALCLCGVAWLASSEDAARRDDLEHETRLVARQFATRLKGALEKCTIALGQMALFLENSQTVTSTEFQSYSASTIRQVPMFLRISLLDTELKVRTVAPIEHNRGLVGVDSRAFPSAHEAATRARDTKAPVFSAPMRLFDGPRGFLLAVPVFKGGRFDGVVIGTVRSADFASALTVPAVLERYEEMVIAAGAHILPGILPEIPPASERPTVVTAFSLGGVSWEVRLTPRLEVVNDRLESGRAAFWTMGVLLTLLVGAAIGTVAYFASGVAHRVRAKDEELRQANQRLDGAMQQLVQAEKLSALGELVAGVAHELNNPLASIMGFLQLLLARDLPSDVKRRIETVYSEAERMAKIVKNLLTFGRKHTPEKKYLGLNGILEKTIEMKTYQFKVNQIKVETDLQPGLPMTMLDFHQIQQVLINLLNNAEHAMAEKGRGGTLRFRTRVVGGHLELRVSDSGPGIPFEIQSRVFEPFYTTKKEGKGTGLGLSICYGIVKEHGGGIRVESEPGKGATFVLDFPIIAAPAAEPAAPEPRGDRRGPLRILVVDDEQAVSEFLVELLTARGHRVDTAADVPEALQKIARSELDLIISDMRLPQGTGRDVHRAAALKEAGLAARMIFTSGDGQSEEILRFVREAGGQMVPKPCTVAEIERAIGQAMAAGAVGQRPAGAAPHGSSGGATHGPAGGAMPGPAGS